MPRTTCFGVPFLDFILCSSYLKRDRDHCMLPLLRDTFKQFIDIGFKRCSAQVIDYKAVLVFKMDVKISLNEV